MPRHHPCLAPLPAPLGLRVRALLGLGFVPPPEPRPCASIAYALLPAARVPLCRHRADPESSSRSLSSGSPARSAPPIAPTARRRPHRAHRAPTSASPPPSLSSRCGGPRALAGKNRTACIPFSPNALKRPPFLATSARNACFSRSRWQHPRPMHPFPGAIGRFGIHGARILPPRALFRVEEPEITHGAKMLPAPPGLSAAAACGPAERALRPAARAWPACRMRPSLPSRLCPPPAFIAAVLCASRFAARIAPTHAAIRRAAHCNRGERRSGSSCRPRAAHADASRPPMRARRHRPSPSPAPTEFRPQANRASSTRGAACAHPRPATRRASPCRAGPAAVSVIPAKWCGDTIAHTRKLRF